MFTRACFVNHFSPPASPGTGDESPFDPPTPTSQSFLSVPQAKSNTFSFDRLLIRMVSAAPLVHEAQAAAAAQLAASSSPTNVDRDAPPSSHSPPQESNGEVLDNQTLEVCTGASPAEKQDLAPTWGVNGSAGNEVDQQLSGGEALVKDSSNPEASDPASDSEPRSWRAEVSLTDIPAPVIAQAAGELAVRLEEERRRQRVAREAGVTKVSAVPHCGLLPLCVLLRFHSCPPLTKNDIRMFVYCALRVSLTSASQTPLLMLSKQSIVRPTCLSCSVSREAVCVSVAQ